MLKGTITMLLVLATINLYPQIEGELLCRHAKGENIIKADLQNPNTVLWKRGYDLSCWNGCGGAIGSQNFPPVAHAAIGDYKWIAELCRHEKKEGITARELGSNASYFGWVTTAKLVGLADARKANATADVKIIEENLLATWAYWSLVTISTPKRDVWVNAVGKIVNEVGNDQKYNGLTTANAGDRCIGGSLPSSTSQKPATYNSSEYGMLLGWAMDWKPRRDDNGNNLRSKCYWWNNTIAHLAKVDKYTQTIPASFFGITDQDRTNLKKVIQGDYAAAEWALSKLQPFGLWIGHPGKPQTAVHVRLRRTDKGAENVYFFATNGNKPANAATQIHTTGLWKSMRPDRFNGTGDNKQYKCWIDNGIIYADVAAGDGAKVSMPELGGNLIWQVDITGKSMSISGGAPDPCVQANNCTNNAQFVSQNVPIQMIPGTKYTIDVTFKNTGTTIWRTVGNNPYKLGSQNQENNMTWGLNRINCPGTIQPGADAKFTFDVTAPSTSGTYDFQWKMLEELKEWFGDMSPNLKINVNTQLQTPKNDAQFVSLQAPDKMQINGTAQVEVILKNTGNSTWTKGGTIPFKLGSQSPQDNQRWGIARVDLPTTSVAPGQNAKFNFTIKAPSNPGTYDFQWKMLRETVEWFGESSTNKKIEVEDVNAGIEETDNVIKVYPNPVNDVLRISNMESLAVIQLINLQGIEVLSLPVKGSSIELSFSDLSPGLYFLRAIGTTEQTFKILKAD